MYPASSTRRIRAMYFVLFLQKRLSVVIGDERMRGVIPLE